MLRHGVLSTQAGTQWPHSGPSSSSDGHLRCDSGGDRLGDRDRDSSSESESLVRLRKARVKSSKINESDRLQSRWSRPGTTRSPSLRDSDSETLGSPGRGPGAHWQAWLCSELQVDSEVGLTRRQPIQSIAPKTTRSERNGDDRTTVLA